MISSNKSVIFNSERGRDIYVENQRIIIRVSPESAPLINTASSYLMFSLLLGNNKTRQGNPNYVIPDPALGGSSPFSSMTIRSGDGSTVLEQLNSCEIWTAMKNYYGNDDNDNNLRTIYEGNAKLDNDEYISINTRARALANSRAWASTTAGLTENPSEGGGFKSQYYNIKKLSNGDNARKTQVLYRFPMSGLLTSMRSELLSVIALQGIIIELQLLEGHKFLRLQEMFHDVVNTNTSVSVGYGLFGADGLQRTVGGGGNNDYGADESVYGMRGYYDDNGDPQIGTQQNPVHIGAATVISGLILENSSDGGDCYPLDFIENCSIKVGSKVRVFYDMPAGVDSSTATGSLLDVVVSQVNFVGERIHIRFAANVTTQAGNGFVSGEITKGNPVVCSLSSAGTPTLADANHVFNVSSEIILNTHRYEVSDVEYIANVVETPPEYLQTMIKQVQSGKLRFQYNTYQDIPVNIGVNSLANEMNIFTDLQRCYSLFGVAETLRSENFLLDSLSPSAQNLRDYQFNIGGINIPNMNVSLRRLAQNRVDTLALIECEKALTESSIPVRNLKNPSRFPIIARRLGAYSSPVNMIGKSLKCRVNYDLQQPLSLLYHWFIYHTVAIEFENGQIVLRK